jgi:hypothetical protein
MTQQNAALVEESAAAAESLKDQATRLAQVVQVFQIDGLASRGLPAPSTPALKALPRKAPVSARAPIAATRQPALAQPRPAPANKALTSNRPAMGKPIATATAASGNEGDWESF